MLRKVKVFVGHYRAARSYTGIRQSLSIARLFTALL